jgi:hypothetical protein
MAGTVTIEGTINTVPPGSASIQTTITASASNLIQIINQVLASGANTISVPSWAVGVLIEPAPTNTIALTLKGVTGDTGVGLSPTNPTLISFPASPPSTFVVTAATVTTTETTFTFF